MLKTNSLLGYPINNSPLTELIDVCGDKIVKETGNRKPLVFSCANPHSLAVAETNYYFRKALSSSDILVTDGVGLSLIGSLFGYRVGPRITGSDFFQYLMERLNASDSNRKKRVVFFGSSEKVLSLIKNRMEKHYKNIECEFISPPFGAWSEEADEEFCQKINDFDADVLWVGMTAPKQELWVQKNRHRLRVSVIGSIGAVFDFVAGTYQRAPLWARKAGLEWLVRLIWEPKRMWKRNFISPVIFLFAMIKFRLFGLTPVSRVGE